MERSEIQGAAFVPDSASLHLGYRVALLSDQHSVNEPEVNGCRLDR